MKKLLLLGPLFFLSCKETVSVESSPITGTWEFQEGTCFPNDGSEVMSAPAVVAEMAPQGDEVFETPEAPIAMDEPVVEDENPILYQAQYTFNDQKLSLIVKNKEATCTTSAEYNVEIAEETIQITSAKIISDGCQLESSGKQLLSQGTLKYQIKDSILYLVNADLPASATCAQKSAVGLSLKKI